MLAASSAVVLPSFLAVASSIHGLEVGRFEIGEVESKVPHITLGIYDQTRNPTEKGFFNQVDPQTGLSRTGHADDHAVGGEVVRVIDNRFVRLDITADVQLASRELHELRR